MGELINLGYKVKVFEIEDYICWGTPNDYETFVYWQSFFSKVNWHEYSLEKDSTVKEDKIGELIKKYKIKTQKYS